MKPKVTEKRREESARRAKSTMRATSSIAKRPDAQVVTASQ